MISSYERYNYTFIKFNCWFVYFELSIGMYQIPRMVYILLVFRYHRSIRSSEELPMDQSTSGSSPISDLRPEYSPGYSDSGVRPPWLSTTSSRTEVSSTSTPPSSPPVIAKEPESYLRSQSVLNNFHSPLKIFTKDYNFYQPSRAGEKEKMFFSTNAFLTVSGQLHAEAIMR